MSPRPNCWCKIVSFGYFFTIYSPLSGLKADIKVVKKTEYSFAECNFTTSGQTSHTKHS